jgi:RND family efflux transporter MFP subunit
MRLVRPGEVEPVRESRVAAALGGAVEKVPVDVGDVVAQGDVLARVDTKMQAANVKLIKVELKDARRELTRLQSMGKSVAAARVDAATTRVERAEAQLSVARINSGRSVVRAPFAGTIADVGTEEGEVLAPGMVVARLIQVDPAVISVSVADRDVGSLQLEGTAFITAAGLSQGVEGTITRIDPTANEKTRTFTVELQVPNPGSALRPGMIANVDFRQTVSAKAILLPQDFLVTRLDTNGVFVVDQDDVARWRPLELGDIVRDQVVVTGGLRAGERIVILGHRGLADGDPLIVAREGTCCTDGRVVFGEADPTGKGAP